MESVKTSLLVGLTQNTWVRYGGALVAVSAIGFVLWPHFIGLVLPPVMLVLGWLSASGPSFSRNPRHPDINAVLNTSAMQWILLRPGWTPKRVSGVWFAAMCVIGITPGVLIGVWPVLFGDGGELTFARLAWWTFVTPLILCAVTFGIEALLQQLIATPLSGLFIVVLLVGAPLGAGHDDWTFESRLAVSAMILGSAVISLWLIDMLRLMTPDSLRAQRIGGK